MSAEKGREEAPVIIIKKKKGAHGGHHGGAWKVAYADFITAMMALFLVLWLIATMSKDTKKAVAEYFRSYTIFKGSEAGGAKGFSMMQGNPVKLNAEPNADIEKKKVMNDKLAADLSKVVEEKLKEFKGQISVLNTKDGVRIELMEMEQSQMFELGKARLLSRGTEMLQVLAASIKDTPYSFVIEGHTDGRKYPTEDYSNWELAADRANAARREFIKHGVDPKKIKKVISFADSEPIKPSNPDDPLNRRVSILFENK